MSRYYAFSEYIKKNQETLAVQIVESVIQKSNMMISSKEKQQAIIMYTGLLGYFSDALTQQEDEVIPESLLEWSKKNAEMQVTTDGHISEIIVRYGPTREVFNDILTSISVELELTVKENASILKLINSMLDISLNETVIAFEKLSDEFKEKTQKELLQLSAPIVPVKEDVVVLPLIGYLDEERADYITDHVIPKIADMGVNYVIADFSGVLTINTHVAESLHRIGETLRLMGITVVATGLRPELVQVIVQSTTIDMSLLKPFATVKQALENIR